MQYKEAYLRPNFDDFKFLDPECHDVRIREINMRTKRCNRCQGFEECKMHPHFWLYGDTTRFAENEEMTEIHVEEPAQPELYEEEEEEEVEA